MIPPVGRFDAAAEFKFRLSLRVSHTQAHHETVELIFGQWVRAFKLTRILGGNHQERLGQWMCHALHRHLSLTHRLKQHFDFEAWCG